VVLFAQDDAFSKSETGTFQETVKSKNLELAPVLTFSTKDTNFQKQATDTINQNPDLVIVSGLAADGGNLVKQLRELGYKGLIIGGNGLNTANVFPVCKAQCDGMLIAQAYSPEAAGAVNDAFKAAYTADQKKNPPQFSAQAFTGVQVIVEALASLDKKSKVSGMSLADLRVALNKEILAGKYDTPLGPISFTPTGEINQTQFYVAQIKMNADGTSGQFTFLK
jgi:branched-chain amino acid transport system substrate-binding protein